MTRYRAVVTVDFEAQDEAELQSREERLTKHIYQRVQAEFPAVDFRIAERRPRKRARCPAPDETWPG